MRFHGRLTVPEQVFVWSGAAGGQRCLLAGRWCEIVEPNRIEYLACRVAQIKSSDGAADSEAAVDVPFRGARPGV